MKKGLNILLKKGHLFMPLLFVTLYGSGFVGAKLGLPYAEPLTFLTLRFIITALLLIIISWVIKAPWPKEVKAIGHMMAAGIFLLGFFSAGVFIAIALGIPPAVSALIIALQPILVSLGAKPFLGEKIASRQWLGLICGLIGVGCVVSHKLTFNNTHLLGLSFSILGLLGLTIGNLYQKRFCSQMNIFTGGVVQSLTAGLASWLGAIFFESMTISWSPEFVFALFWMSVVVSIGALSILYVLIRQGEASEVASLFYLVPVSAAVFAYLFYKEHLGVMGILGIGTIAFGIFLIQSSKKRTEKQENLKPEFQA